MIIFCCRHPPVLVWMGGTHVFFMGQRVTTGCNGHLVSVVTSDHNCWDPFKISLFEGEIQVIIAVSSIIMAHLTGLGLAAFSRWLPEDSRWRETWRAGGVLSDVVMTGLKTRRVTNDQSPAETNTLAHSQALSYHKLNLSNKMFSAWPLTPKQTHFFCGWRRAGNSSLKDLQ